jgi:RNA polymerase sigma factor (sigma-70 family)
MAPLLAQKRGVDRTFERLYRQHALDVYRYAYAVLRNQADAEDVAQTTFMNAYRALERGEAPQSPHNWLIAIAHNVCRQRFRQASRRVQEVGFDEDVADSFVRPEEDDAPSPEDIRRALGHLAFNQRAALVMRELEGRSYAEIAEVLGLTVSAVETLLFRARRALREQLEASFTCEEAEQTISRQLDRRLSRAERSQLRGHLRECADCRRVARSQRAQRASLKAFGAVPLPQSLAALFGGGAAVATKAAVVVVTAGLAGGIGWNVHHRLVAPPAKPAPARHVVPAARPRSVTAERPSIATSLAPVPRSHPKAARRTHRPAVVPASQHAVAVRAATQLPLHPTYPTHPAHPVHPAHPTHPVHPVQPARPVDPAPPVRKSHPQHPVQPQHPAHPTEAKQPTHGGPPATPPGQAGDEQHGKPAKLPVQAPTATLPQLPASAP